MSVSPRPLAATDLAVLAELHRRCFPEDPWDREAFARLLAMPGTTGWLALDGAGREALGFLLARQAADEAEVLSFGVLPERRRAGVGAGLLEQAFAALAAGGVARLFLEVAVDNAPALRLYRRQGFVEVGRRPGYLKTADGRRDALVMARRLPA